jgi:predicted RNA methylase
MTSATHDLAAENRRHYSQLYAAPGALRAYEVRDKVQILLAHPALHSVRGRHVIDLGFGSGALTLALLKRGAFVCGVENVTTALDALEAFASADERPRLRLIQASVDALPGNLNVSIGV